MGMNRHRSKEIQEVWDSFEWLYREKLESLDYLTRQMIKEMEATGADIRTVRSFVPKKFAGLWQTVSQEREGKK
jgi:hypothetical protein